jgi:hypothetical protein
MCLLLQLHAEISSPCSEEWVSFVELSKQNMHKREHALIDAKGAVKAVGIFFQSPQSIGRNLLPATTAGLLI